MKKVPRRIEIRGEVDLIHAIAVSRRRHSESWVP